MKRLSVYFLLLLMVPALGFAQQREIKEEGKTIFKPHAYLQLQGGAAHTIGEAEFIDLISPAAALNLGYQFSPVFGMRLGASGWQGKGGWVSPAQTYDFKFVQGNLDLVLDLASLFGGFNPDRAVTPYLFAGGAYAYGFENGATDLNIGDYNLEYLWDESRGFLGGHFGLGFNFRLSDAVALTLEGNSSLLSDRFNSKRADNPDWQINALAGIKINLGKTYSRTEPVIYDPPAQTPPPAPAPAPRPEPKPESKPVVVKQFPELPPIHFAFDSDAVDTQKHANELATIVSVLKEFSDTDVIIVGYTDHAGPDVYNDGLSVRRAEAVKNYLVGQGINAARLSTSGEGKDPKTSGSEALTIQARRVEVQEK